MHIEKYLGVKGLTLLVSHNCINNTYNISFMLSHRLYTTIQFWRDHSQCSSTCLPDSITNRYTSYHANHMKTSLWQINCDSYFVINYFLTAMTCIVILQPSILYIITIAHVDIVISQLYIISVLLYVCLVLIDLYTITIYCTCAVFVHQMMLSHNGPQSIL